MGHARIGIPEGRIREVARRADVSRDTIYRLLSGARVKADTEARIRRAAADVAAELGGGPVPVEPPDSAAAGVRSDQPAPGTGHEPPPEQTANYRMGVAAGRLEGAITVWRALGMSLDEVLAILQGAGAFPAARAPVAPSAPAQAPAAAVPAGPVARDPMAPNHDPSGDPAFERAVAAYEGEVEQTAAELRQLARDTAAPPRKAGGGRRRA